LPRPTPTQLRTLIRRDPVLGRALREAPIFPDLQARSRRQVNSHFHALAQSIIYQQLAGRAAAAIHARVRALTAGPRFPTAAEVLRLSRARLRDAGLSGSKVEAMRDLARRVESGELPLRSVSRRSDEEIIELLTRVKGIGIWSAQMFLMFRLGRLDVLPTTDLGIREGVKRLDGLSERPTPSQVETRGEPWHPLCTVASWVLWRQLGTSTL